MKDFEVAFMHNNLNQITGFHNHVHGFFNDNLADSQKSTEITSEQKSLLKSSARVSIFGVRKKSRFKTECASKCTVSFCGRIYSSSLGW